MKGDNLKKWSSVTFTNVDDLRDTEREVSTLRVIDIWIDTMPVGNFDYETWRVEK